MFPEIVLKLTGKHFQTEEAILKGYKRYKIIDEKGVKPYPAIIKSKNSYVKGKVLFDVDKDGLRILDYFEGEEYNRKKEVVFVKTKKLEAYVYIWNEGNKEKLTENWNPEEFRKKHLKKYLDKIVPFYLNLNYD